MKNFLHWRKMTWVIAAWSAFMLVWVAVGSSMDSAVAAFALWAAGLVALSLIWFATRAPWRHGRGLRLRRHRTIEDARAQARAS